MIDIDNLLNEAVKAIELAENIKNLEDIRVKYLGKKSELQLSLIHLKDLDPAERPAFGQVINNAKNILTENIESRHNFLTDIELQNKLSTEYVDIALPIRPESLGSIHPNSRTIDELIDICSAMGFTHKEGPDIEDAHHNFTALNMPELHPARQMHDTFYVKSPNNNDEPYLLRTHTSNVQIRHMSYHKPPYRIIATGRTYRSDFDMTHTPMFHQIEGLCVDKDINIGHMKWCIQNMVEKFFAIHNLPLRFRSSYFPFTEPSFEVDIACNRKGDIIEIGTGSDWLEILGCGMVHPNVLQNVGVDHNQYQGFAWGGGIERFAMLKYGIADLRTFFEADKVWNAFYGLSPYLK